MYEANLDLVLRSIAPTDKVLDIGGWAMPFNRANYVLDIGSYETRGMFGAQGPSREHFKHGTWIERDLCDKEPYPFSDKFFDFVVCSHTLEDIRDPLWVCSEMQRVARAGYIEVPSIVSELSLGVENRRYAGRNHHRWLIKIQDDQIIFTFKHHHIHTNWEHHLPAGYYRRLRPEECIQYLFWNDSFEYTENILLTSDDVNSFYAAQVNMHPAYTPYRYKVEEAKKSLKAAVKRILKPLQ